VLAKPAENVLPAAYARLIRVLRSAVLGLGVNLSPVKSDLMQGYYLTATKRGGVAGCSSSTSSSMHFVKVTFSTLGAYYGWLAAYLCSMLTSQPLYLR